MKKYLWNLNKTLNLEFNSFLKEWQFKIQKYRLSDKILTNYFCLLINLAISYVLFLLKLTFFPNIRINSYYKIERSCTLEKVAYGLKFVLDSN